LLAERRARAAKERTAIIRVRKLMDSASRALIAQANRASTSHLAESLSQVQEIVRQSLEQLNFQEVNPMDEEDD
jgi:hypothetical protein